MNTEAKKIPVVQRGCASKIAQQASNAPGEDLGAEQEG